MKKEVTNKSASVLAKLYNLSRTENIDYNHLLLRYCQERFLYRLSVSKYATNFCLKGGLFLTCLNISSNRTTKDIDFLARQISNEIINLENIVAEIANLEFGDGVIFDSDAITAEEIVEAGDYPGIRIKMPALIGKAKLPIQLDFAWGDIIQPKDTILDFRTIFDNEEPLKLIAYSIESVVSEKFQAIVKLASANSRMKDFYDIYALASNHDFNLKELRSAVLVTFNNRSTALSDIPIVFQADFTNNTKMQNQWDSFLKRQKLEDVPRDFTIVMARITALLKPLVVSILENKEFDSIWNSNKGSWS